LGRNRKKAFQRLPKYVYAQRKRIIYRPPGEQAVVIGSIHTPLPDIWSAFKKLTNQENDTLDYLVREYLKSDQYNDLKSKKERKRLLDALLNTDANGRFGSKHFGSITPGVIRKYLDYRNCVTGNREVASLSAAWSYCYQRDIVTTPNPCKGVSKVKEQHRTRLVTDAEYKAAHDLMPKHVQVAMELAYLCRMRLSEVLDTKCKDIESEGLNTRRLKGSDSALTLWSERLQKAVNRGLGGVLRVPDMTIVNQNGSPVRRSSFQTTWQRRMKNFEPRFTFHDLKAKGVSDFEGDKKKASGHKSEAMMRVYDRKRIEIDATD
jgi:integrase